MARTVNRHDYHPENRFGRALRYNRFRHYHPHLKLAQFPRIIQTIAICIKFVQGGKLGKSNPDSNKQSTRTCGMIRFP